METNILEIQNLSVSIKKLQIFKNLNLSIRNKAIITILGDSGAGKTTLLKTLNGLIPFESGIISILGQKIDYKNRLCQMELPQKLGLVFQDFNLYPHLTVIDNITLALRLKKEKSKELIEKEAMFWLTQLHIESKKDNYPSQLSGGEKQRVAIARAAILNPQILCFDEPTSALDPLLKTEVANLIKNLSKTMTILIVTHDIEFAKEISERVIVMKNGNIFQDQEANSFFNNKYNS